MPCSTRTRLVVATPTQSAPPISIFTHGKRSVSRVSAQYTENLGVMVERPWALTRDTTVLTLYYIKSTLTRVCNLHSSSVDGVFHE